MRSGILGQGEQTSPLVLWLEPIGVIMGVGLPLPMFFASARMGYMMAGMAIDPMMIFGMGLIVLGFAAVAYGLIPASRRAIADSGTDDLSPLAEGGTEERLTPAHWFLMLTLTFALIIDTMKPASLAFVVHG